MSVDCNGILRTCVTPQAPQLVTNVQIHSFTTPPPAALDYIVRFFSQQVPYIETEAAAKQLFNRAAQIPGTETRVKRVRDTGFVLNGHSFQQEHLAVTFPERLGADAGQPTSQ